MVPYKVVSSSDLKCFDAGQLIGFDFSQEISPHTDGVVFLFCITLPTLIQVY